MKELFLNLLLLIVISLCFTTSLFTQKDRELNRTTSTFGVHVSYQETILRNTLGYDYESIYFKDNFTNEFRGYAIGVSYNKLLQDNNDFATLTLEALLQRLPIYSEDVVGSYWRVYDLNRPPTRLKNSIANYMVTINGMYNFNLFNTGVDFTLGGSIGYVFNKQIITKAIVDSNVIDLMNESILTPIEPYEIGKESTFTSVLNSNIQPFRVALLLGLQYNFTIQSTEFEPFIRYSHALTNHDNSTYNSSILHSLQSGISIRFPF